MPGLDLLGPEMLKQMTPPVLKSTKTIQNIYQDDWTNPMTYSGVRMKLTKLRLSFDSSIMPANNEQFHINTTAAKPEEGSGNDTSGNSKETENSSENSTERNNGTKRKEAQGSFMRAYNWVSKIASNSYKSISHTASSLWQGIKNLFGKKRKK